MKYVGATNGFIRWPFLIEGMLLGLIGAIIAVLCVGEFYHFITMEVSEWRRTKTKRRHKPWTRSR